MNDVMLPGDIIDRDGAWWFCGADWDLYGPHDTEDEARTACRRAGIEPRGEVVS